MRGNDPYFQLDVSLQEIHTPPLGLRVCRRFRPRAQTGHRGPLGSENGHPRPPQTLSYGIVLYLGVPYSTS